MNRHATVVHRRAWRLILTIATGNEDARRTLAAEVGEDAKAWYLIANIAALQAAQLLDAEYLAAEAMRQFADNPDLGRPQTEAEASALIAAERDRALADPSLPCPRPRIQHRPDPTPFGRRPGHTCDGLMSIDRPPIQQCDDGTVLVSGAAVPLLYRAVLALPVRHRRDGVSSPPALHELRATLYRATMSRPRHELSAATRRPFGPCGPGQHGADLIGVSEAAVILSISPRQVQRLAARNAGLDGHRLGRAWALRRAPVLVLAAQRKAAAE